MGANGLITKLGSGLQNNSVANVLLKAFTMLLSFLFIRISLSYLGNALYGIWMLIYSIATWTDQMDFGIGHGLRNELSSAIARKDSETQRSLCVFSLKRILILAFWIFVVVIVLYEALIKLSLFPESHRMGAYIFSSFYCARMALTIGNSICYANQVSTMVFLARFSSVFFQVFNVILLRAVVHETDINIFAIAVGIGLLFPNAALTIYAWKRFVPSVQTVSNENKNKKVLKTGFGFFTIQICGIILFSTDNLIVNRLFGEEAVTSYSVINQVYSGADTVFLAILIPLWSAVTLHAVKNEYEWIDNRINELKRAIALYAFMIILLSFAWNQIARIALQYDHRYGKYTIIIFAIYCIYGAYLSMYIHVMNGLGLIKVQIIVAALEALINIPLSVYLAWYLDYGIYGVKLATLLCQMVGGTILIIACKRYLTEKMNTM